MAALLGDGKILAQTNPAAATLTDSYTVPASTKTEVQDIVACNRSAVATSIRIAVAVAGAVDDNKQYLLYDYVIAGNGVVSLADLRGGQSLLLAATDKVRVYATLATISFNVLGREVGA